MNNLRDSATRNSKLWIIALVLSLLSGVLVAVESGQAQSDKIHETRVREFVAAFNERNIDGMLALADENIQWLSINAATVSVETEGKEKLRQSMEKYFRSCPSCKSTLESVQPAGERVTAMERATWSGKDGVKSQRGLAVYEFRADKILRVYYFPAETEAKD